MGKGKISARWHLDRDPNDPRLVPNANALPSLNEDPELPVELPEVAEVVTERPNSAGTTGASEWSDKEELVTVTTYLGRDPNDVRLHAN